MAKLKVVGIDGALLNFGVAVGKLDQLNNTLHIVRIEHIAYKRPKKNKVLSDVNHLKFLSEKLRAYCRGADIVCAELAYGSQSASAAWSLGAAMAVIASLPKEITWVSSSNVKRFTKNKTKREMINWAAELYPGLSWPKRSGRILNSAEHTADAIGVLHTALGILMSRKL